MRRRGFSSQATHHIYQRCASHGVLFYTVEDRLVYYTLAACKAKKHGIIVSAAALMYTHIHQSVHAPSLNALRAYLHDTGSSFSRLYNHHYGRHGRLFEKDPGRSQKYSSKDKRSNLAYVYNNHVEKGLCARAVEERWSLIAYACSTHPFSEKIVKRKASKALLKAIRLVNRRAEALKAMEYCDLEKVFDQLVGEEREQFIDYVISRYAWIDYSYAVAHFDSLSAMIIALDTMTGGEYEIREDYTKLKDTGYQELIQMAEKTGLLKDVFRMSTEEKIDAAYLLDRMTRAHPDHLRRFFHFRPDMQEGI